MPLLENGSNMFGPSKLLTPGGIDQRPAPDHKVVWWC
jgi:hypothetical protein